MRTISIIRFIAVVAILYSVILFVLSHIPEILAVCITMFLVHCGLQATKDNKPQDKSS
jgi:hypothetical protein